MINDIDIKRNFFSKFFQEINVQNQDIDLEEINFLNTFRQNEIIKKKNDQTFELPDFKSQLKLFKDAGETLKFDNISESNDSQSSKTFSLSEIIKEAFDQYQITEDFVMTKESPDFSKWEEEKSALINYIPIIPLPFYSILYADLIYITVAFKYAVKLDEANNAHENYFMPFLLSRDEIISLEGDQNKIFEKYIKRILNIKVFFKNEENLFFFIDKSTYKISNDKNIFFVNYKFFNGWKLEPFIVQHYGPKELQDIIFPQYIMVNEYYPLLSNENQNYDPSKFSKERLCENYLKSFRVYQFLWIILRRKDNGKDFFQPPVIVVNYQSSGIYVSVSSNSIEYISCSSLEEYLKSNESNETELFICYGIDKNKQKEIFGERNDKNYFDKIEGRWMWEIKDK